MAVGHAVVPREVVVEFLSRDRALGQHPLARHLFALENLFEGQQRRAPLEVRVDGGEAGEPRILPLAQEAQLVLTRHDGVRLAGVLERLDRGDGSVASIHPDTLHVALGELVRDDLLDLGRVSPGEVVGRLNASFREQLVGASPALLEHVNTRQDPERDNLVAFLEVVDEELSRVDTPREATDWVDERDRAIRLHAAIEDVVFIGIAALVIVLIAKNGRRAAQPKSLGGYHAEWTFSRGGAGEPPLSAEPPTEQRQDPAGPPPAVERTDSPAVQARDAIGRAPSRGTRRCARSLR